MQILGPSTPLVEGNGESELGVTIDVVSIYQTYSIIHSL